MKCTTGYFAVIILLISSIGIAADDFYGPKTVEVDGKREKIKESFEATAGAEATLMIINGIDGPRAKSVKVVINGSRVAARKQVNPGVRSYSSGITLQKTNSLKIVVKGDGASVLIRIIPGQRNLLDRVAAVGDSIAAGMQGFTLVEERQVWSFPAQIADAAGVELSLPLIGEPGLPARSIEIVNGIPILLPPQPSGERINPEEQPHNLAVTGADVADALNKKKAAGDPQFEAILGGKRTMIEHVERLDPTLVLMWIGNNDVLGMVLNTDPSQHTDLTEFRADFETLLQHLTATGAEVVAANLVDITVIPYLIAPPDSLGRSADDRISVLDWLAVLLGQKSTVTEDEVLTPAELESIRATVSAFNDIIEELCDEYGVALIDTEKLFAELHANGISVGGTTLTTVLFEGVFSLDAVHPSSTAQAVLANEYINLINREFDVDIALIDLEEVFLNDPLQQNAEIFSQGVAAKDPTALKALKRIIEQRPLHTQKR